MSYGQTSSKAMNQPALAILPWPSNVKHDEGYFQITPYMVIVTDKEPSLLSMSP